MLPNLIGTESLERSLQHSSLQSTKEEGGTLLDLIETDYFETGSTETICSAGPYSIALDLKVEMIGFSISLSRERTLAG